MSSLPCLSCSRSFSNQRGLYAHQTRFHGACACLLCDEIFDTIGALTSHTMAASERHRPQHAARCTRGPQCRPQDCFGVPGLKAGKIPLAPWVDRSFPSRGQNISHSKTNNGSRSNTRSKPRVPNSSKANSWKCKLCDKVFKTPSALRSHMISSTKKHQTKTQRSVLSHRRRNEIKGRSEIQTRRSYSKAQELLLQTLLDRSACARVLRRQEQGSLTPTTRSSTMPRMRKAGACTAMDLQLRVGAMSAPVGL
ncbi:hypothetical protein BKA70DRAFT_1272684, partial [Coprinopsis sp. MPI-PUGE-AT-0042]